MKKILLFAASLLMVSPMAMGANVDATAARASAERFLLNQSSSRFTATVPNLQLAHAEMNSKLATTPVYYVFNSSNGFVIVSVKSPFLFFFSPSLLSLVLQNQKLL